MKPLRRRKLSTFLISTPEPPRTPQSTSSFHFAQAQDAFEARWGISSVRHRNVLDIGLSPRMSRSTADLRLQNLRNCGWSWPETDPRRVVQSSKGIRRFTPTRGLGPRTDITPTPPKSNAGQQEVVQNMSLSVAEDQALLSSRSLPPLSSEGLSLLRRPTVERTEPVNEEGPMFKMIIKGRELKPYSFQGDTVKSDEFYAQHFPLLCHKLKDGSLPSSAITKQVVEEQLRMPSGRRRARDMRERLWRVEETLEMMEKEAQGEGEAMATELRDVSFDPTAWVWNQERYSSPQERELETALVH